MPNQRMPAWKQNVIAITVSATISIVFTVGMVFFVETFIHIHPKDYAQALAGDLSGQAVGCTREPDHRWYLCEASGGGKSDSTYKLVPDADSSDCWKATPGKISSGRSGNSKLRPTHADPIEGCIGKGLAGKETDGPDPLTVSH